MAQQAEQVMRQLEMKEQAIIERLKNTQKTENNVRQMLVQAIIATSKGKKQRLQELTGSSFHVSTV